jgi:hypothetical protein
MFDNARIFRGLAPLALPICYLAKLTHGWETAPMTYNEPATEHEWLRTEHCQQCEIETDHEYAQFKDEPVVTRTCLSCGHVATHWDLV